MKNYDVIVVGAGNGGLCAAAYAAKNGCKTLLVERHNLPGGCASSFRRGRFEFETALHELCEFGSHEDPGAIRKIFDELELDVEMVPVEDCFRVKGMGGIGRKGYDVIMPNGRENFINALEKEEPGSRSSAEKFFALCEKADGFVKFMTERQGQVTEEELDERFGSFMQYAGMTLDEVLDHVGFSDRAKNIMATYWSYICVPSDEIEFVLYGNLMNEYVNRHAWIPTERSHGISTAFDAKIREFGGDIWYNTTVDEILVEGGDAKGVRIGDEIIYARQIIANVNPNIVYGKLIAPQEVPKKALQLANARTLGVSALTVYYGLNKSAQELGITDYSRFVNTKSSRATFENFGKLNRKMVGGVMNCLNVPIPDYSPDGTCVLWGTTLLKPGTFDETDLMDYPDLKSDLALGFARFYKFTTGIDIVPYIEEVEVATPLTFARYLGTPDGAIYGYQGQRWDNMMPRILAKKNERWISHLDFCGGHDVWLDGYNSSYHTGKTAGENAARAIKEGC